MPSQSAYTINTLLLPMNPELGEKPSQIISGETGETEDRLYSREKHFINIRYFWSWMQLNGRDTIAVPRKEYKYTHMHVLGTLDFLGIVMAL